MIIHIEAVSIVSYTGSLIKIKNRKNIKFQSSPAFSKRLITFLYSSSKLLYSWSRVCIRCSNVGRVMFIRLSMFFNAHSNFTKSFCSRLYGIFNLLFISNLYLRYSCSFAKSVARNLKISYTLRACF